MPAFFSVPAAISTALADPIDSCFFRLVLNVNSGQEPFLLDNLGFD